MSNIKKNLSYSMIYKVLTIITPLITSPIISRAFGAEGMGLYSATIAYVTYYTLFAMLGIENYGNRSISVVQSDLDARSSLFWEIYSVQIVSSIFSIVVYIGSFVFIDKERWSLTLIQGIWLLSYLFDINWFFFGMEQFKLTVIRNTIIKIITVLIIAFFIRTQDDLNLYAIIMGLGAFVGQIVLWFYINKFVVFKKPTYSKVKKHIIPILKLYVPIIAISLFRLMDKSMLDLFSTEREVGYYYNSDKIISIPLSLAAAVSSVCMPRISNIIHNNSINAARNIISKSVELSFIIISSVSFGIAAISNEFVPLFFGNGYNKCIILIYLFIPVLIIKTMENIICQQYLIPCHKDNLYIIAMFSGALANIISNICLISYLGARGAVVGTLIAEIVILIVLLLNSKDFPFIRWFFHQSNYILFGIIMFVLVRWFSQFIVLNNFLKVIIMMCFGGAIYSICCLIWGLINKNSILYNPIHNKIGKL